MTATASLTALAFEASSRAASVALLRGVASDPAAWSLTSIPPESGAARGLAPAARDLLRSAGLAPADLQMIAVCLGPGAYTGTRMALATAKTMAAVLDLPILGVPSTSALAAHPDLPAGRILTLLDARKGLVYGGLHERPAEGLPVSLDGPFLRPIESILPGLDEVSFVAGDGLPVLCDARERAAGSDVAPLHGDATLSARAREVLLVAIERFSRGERDQERILLPLYLRPSEAEIRFNARLDQERPEPSG